MTGPIAADTGTPLEACPTACQPRPRDPDTYCAASHAAQGEPIAELDAAEAAIGMHIWHNGRFLPITSVVRDGDTVELEFATGDGTASRWASRSTPLYRLGR